MGVGVVSLIAMVWAIVSARRARAEEAEWRARIAQVSHAEWSVRYKSVDSGEWRTEHVTVTVGRRRESHRPARRSRPAVSLTRAAVRVLPAAERDRYAEEFRAELYDLALSGAGPLRQVLYGVRQVRGTFLLSFALRAPRRRGAAQ
jgi:hypothetical protein